MNPRDMAMKRVGVIEFSLPYLKNASHHPQIDGQNVEAIYQPS
jgi:hypothetical protein